MAWSSSRVASCCFPPGPRATNASRAPSGEIAAVMLGPSTASGPRSVLKRISGRSTGRVPRHAIQDTPSNPTASAAATAHSTRLWRRAVPSGVSSSSNSTPVMSRRRLWGSFSRHRLSNRCTFAGTRSHSGSLVSTAASVADTVSPWNMRRPVSISYSSTPNAHISARLSTGFP